MSDVNIKIQINAKQAIAAVDKLNRSLGGLDRKVGDTNRKIDGFGTSLGKVGKIALSFAAFKIVQIGFQAITTAVGDSIDAFADFETGLVGVAKTTDLAGSSLAEFGASIEDLSTEIPVTAKELLKLAQVAGQLGIRGTANLRKFAETGARLAVSTNLAGEVAVKSLSRIIGVTKDSQENVDRLGSSLVQLGNTFKADEDEILNAARALAQSTAGLGIASDEILGIAAAIKEAGLGSEKAATAVGKLFTDFVKGASQGSEEAKEFAKLLGISLDDLLTRIDEDAAGVFGDFITQLGLGNTKATELTKTLDSLGIKNQRSIQTVRALASIQDRLNIALDSSRKAYQENTALLDESEKAFDTYNSRVQTGLNGFTALGRVIGSFVSGPLGRLILSTGKAAENLGLLLEAVFGDKASSEIAQNRLELERWQKELDSANATIEGSKKLLKTETRDGFINRAIFFMEQAELKAARAKKRIEELKEATETTGGAIAGPEQGKDDTAGNAAKQNNALEIELQRRQEIINNFVAIRNEQTEEQTQEDLLVEEARFDSELALLVEQLGAAETARILARSRDLEAQGKHNQAVEVLRQANIKAEENAAKTKVQLDKRSAQQRISIADNLGNLINAIAGRQTVVGFALQKAAAAAQVIVSSLQAEAAALAPPPLGLGPVAGIGLAGLIKTNRNIQLATIAATAIKGFQNGGVVGGNSFSGDNVVARVNSGEMILNRQQQAQLFTQANGQGQQQGGPQEVVVHTTVELDGEAIGASVSRQVADGLELGKVV